MKESDPASGIRHPFGFMDFQDSEAYVSHRLPALDLKRAVGILQ
jgi:hypothetical protein